MNLIEWLFGAASFVPHGVCLLWRPDLVALHAVSDVLIAAAYFAIPAAIWTFVKLRTDLRPEHRRVAVLFSAFIMWCGMTHVAGLVTLWQPFYGAQALIKAATASVSVVTAFAVWPLLPKLLSLPSPSQLQAANARLTAALAEVEQIKAGLERQVAERTEELRLLNARFERALDGSSISVFEQDEDLVYTWVYNPPEPKTPETVVGREDAELLGRDPDGVGLETKRRALAEGGLQQAQFSTLTDDDERWWVLSTAPALLQDGRPGLLSAGVDVTPQVRQQQHLRVIMRELNHRTKNLLAMIQAIARQSGRGGGSLEDFQARFFERIQALAESHDLLVATEWTGADLESVVRRQLKDETADRPERLSFEGPELTLAPEAAHYLGLALHELYVNALKHGALSADGGRLSVRWERENDDFVLLWTEVGGPPSAAAPGRGFGRTLLETVAPAALRGKAALRFDEAGVSYRLSAPWSVVEAGSKSAGRSPVAPAESQPAVSSRDDAR